MHVITRLNPTPEHAVSSKGEAGRGRVGVGQGYGQGQE